MNDCTAHVLLPDAALGSMFQMLVLEDDRVTFCSSKFGGTSWISFGVMSFSEEDTINAIIDVRNKVSQSTVPSVPEGYGPGVVSLFETAPMIVTSGRTVAYCEHV